MSIVPPSSAQVAPIPLSLIDEHPDNPRIASWNLEELVDSIRKVGVLTPCIVRTQGEKRFQLLAGHRRVRALRELGQRTAPCVVIQAPNSQAWRILLTENIQRRNLNLIEEARAYQSMRREGLTILAIANQLSCSEQRVSRRLALLELEPGLQEQILAKDLSLNEAWGLVATQRDRRRGPKAGEGTGRHTKWNEHFNQNHTLADEAGEQCDSEGHAVTPRLGPACAACWEETIRDDQHLETQFEIFEGFEDEDDLIKPRKRVGVTA